MTSGPHTIPVTELLGDTTAVLRRVRESGEPLVVTEHGAAAAVLMSVDAYERSEHERRLLLLFARAEREVAAGPGHTLDDALAEVDALLAHP